MELSGQLHAPATVPLKKEPQYPLDRRLGGPQSQSAHCGNEKNLLALPEFEPRPSNPSLYQLNYTGSPADTETVVNCREAAVITQNLKYATLFHGIQL
jgi:hypothetical protein